MINKYSKTGILCLHKCAQQSTCLILQKQNIHTAETRHDYSFSCYEAQLA